MAELHVFRIDNIDDGECFWYIAESSQEAEKMYNDDLVVVADSDMLDEQEKPEIVQEEDSDQCAVKMAQNEKKVDEITVIYITESEVREDYLGILNECLVRTYGEWIQLKGKGFFASKSDF